jgi:hypothetical protein
MPCLHINTSVRKEVNGMLFFLKFFAEALVFSSCYKKEEESLRRLSSRLSNNAEHTRVIVLPKGTKSFGKGIVDADSSSHLQSTCVY